jgi:hemoglobin-like flavoprotein
MLSVRATRHAATNREWTVGFPKPALRLAYLPRTPSRRDPGDSTDPDERKPMDLDLHALETSFDLVAPRGEELIDEFYARLFEIAPAVMPLFTGTDMKRQKAMLLGALVLLRKSLRDLDAIVPTLRKLGARHVAYGAQPDHYPAVGEALIGAMAATAGSAWLPNHETAWRQAFAIVAATMLDGATATTLKAAA